MKHLREEVPHIAGAGRQQNAKPHLNAVNIAANVIVLIDTRAVAAVAQDTDHPADGGVALINRAVQIVFIELHEKVEQRENALCRRDGVSQDGGVIVVVTARVDHEQAVVGTASLFDRSRENAVHLLRILISELLCYVCPKAGVIGSLPAFGVLNRRQKHRKVRPIVNLVVF
ncbi:hypothetical protein SDC9_193688 [bioreactor metagenome]|uniref:Uncharacterized protein n=1 Tax=bioreactor metagenome TaxID=1076179 RepID=A0A645I475_9ZZZZ